MIPIENRESILIINDLDTELAEGLAVDYKQILFMKYHINSPTPNTFEYSLENSRFVARDIDSYKVDVAVVSLSVYRIIKNNQKLFKNLIVYLKCKLSDNGVLIIMIENLSSASNMANILFGKSVLPSVMDFLETAGFQCNHSFYLRFDNENPVEIVELKRSTLLDHYRYCSSSIHCLLAKAIIYAGLTHRIQKHHLIIAEKC